MGVQEKIAIHNLVNDLSGTTSQLSFALALIDSLPNGVPARNSHASLSEVIARLSEDEDLPYSDFMDRVVQLFWPDNATNQGNFRSGLDPKILNAFASAYMRMLPIVAFTAKSRGSDPLGTRFINDRNTGVNLEIFETNKRYARIPLNKAPIVDPSKIITRSRGLHGGEKYLFLPSVSLISIAVMTPEMA